MSPLKYDSAGRIIVDSVEPVVSWANGLPLTADGALAVAVSGDVQGFANGIPYDEEGKVVTNG